MAQFSQHKHSCSSPTTAASALTSGATPEAVAADLAPLLLLSPIAGAVTDRITPVIELRITQWLQFIQAVLLATLMYFGLVTIWILFAITLALGCVHAFGSAARHATVPNTVPRHLVATAVSLDSALFQASRFIGPAIAAIGIGWKSGCTAVS